MNSNDNKRKKSGPVLYKIMIYIIIIILFYHIVDTSTYTHERKLFHLPFSLHLNKQSIVLIQGEEYKLSINGINKRVSYSSTNFRVAGVNFNGRVYAYRTGKATILAKVDKKVLRCGVHVININKEQILLKEGSKYRLKIKGMICFPKWRSSSPEVATVSSFGKVTAKQEGLTVITAKIKGRTIKCTVTVE